ncbi:hypothetical protein SESBI_48974 [Sesbania bispinosa]|nr:hypothetical protein SESBI_48974 [Sesbania bispinosa]
MIQQNIKGALIPQFGLISRSTLASLYHSKHFPETANAYCSASTILASLLRCTDSGHVDDTRSSLVIPAAARRELILPPLRRTAQATDLPFEPVPASCSAAAPRRRELLSTGPAVQRPDQVPPPFRQAIGAAQNHWSSRPLQAAPPVSPLHHPSHCVSMYRSKGKVSGLFYFT